MKAIVKMFKILDPRTDEDVLGEAVSEHNAYIAIYPEWLEDNTWKDLDVGQSTMAKFWLSGSMGVYRVVRQPDRADD